MFLDFKHFFFIFENTLISLNTKILFGSFDHESLPTNHFRVQLICSLILQLVELNRKRLLICYFVC